MRKSSLISVLKWNPQTRDSNDNEKTRCFYELKIGVGEDTEEKEH